MEAYLERHVRSRDIKIVSRKYTLTDGVAFVVDDYTVAGYDDDAFYEKFGYDTLLRRGTVRVAHAPDDGEESVVSGRKGVARWVLGFPKFGYDPDEASGVSGAVKWCFTEKENGECGHVAAMRVRGRPYFVVGSKNVHIVLGGGSWFETDLEMYAARNEPRLEYAVRIARLLGDLGFFDRAIAHHLLETSRVCIVETIFNDHIVWYEGGHQFRVTAMLEEDGAVMDPVETRRLCEGFGAPFVVMDVACDRDAYDRLEADFTSCSRDTEGAVVYVVGMEGACAGRVIHMYKVKHPLYVVKRAARELIKRRATLAQWKERMDGLHVSVPDEVVRELLQFYAWVATMHPGAVGQRSFPFATLFREFREDEGRGFIDPAFALSSGRNTTASVVAFCGLPGSGKTLMSTWFVELVRERYGGALRVVRINQDELGRQSKKAFLRKLDEVAEHAGERIVVIDRCNHTAAHRDEVESRFADVKWVVLNGSWETCLERVEARGPYHPTLVLSCDTPRILRRFAEESDLASFSCDKLVGDGRRVLGLDMGDAFEENAKKVMAFLGYDDGGSGKTDLGMVRPSARPKLPRILYWKIDLPAGKHVTLRYKPTAQETEELLPHFGKRVVVEIDYVIETENIRVASVVKTDFLDRFCQNKHPHVTLWTASGTSPVESNRTFDNPNAKRRRWVIGDDGQKIEGIVTFCVM